MYTGKYNLGFTFYLQEKMKLFDLNTIYDFSKI